MTTLDKELQIPLWATMLGAEFFLNNQKNNWKYIVINEFFVYLQLIVEMYSIYYSLILHLLT